MEQGKYVLSLDSFEHRLLINGLNDFRNNLIEQQMPTEDVNSLLLKVIDAPKQKEKHRRSHETR